MAGIPEVSANHTFTVGALFGNLSGAHDRGVGCEDTIVRAVLLDASKEVLLGFHDFGSTLDDEVGIGVCSGIISLEVDTTHNSGLLFFSGGATGNHDIEVVGNCVPTVVL